jgi:hypothetical protein
MPKLQFQFSKITNKLKIGGGVSINLKNLSNFFKEDVNICPEGRSNIK